MPTVRAVHDEANKSPKLTNSSEPWAIRIREYEGRGIFKDLLDLRGKHGTFSDLTDTGDGARTRRTTASAAEKEVNTLSSYVHKPSAGIPNLQRSVPCRPHRCAKDVALLTNVRFGGKEPFS